MQRFGGVEKAQVTSLSTKLLAPVVQRLDNVIWWINRYPLDKCSQNKPRYLLDRDLLGDSIITLLNNPGVLRNMENVPKSIIIYDNFQIMYIYFLQDLFLKCTRPPILFLQKCKLEAVPKATSSLMFIFSQHLKFFPATVQPEI